MHIEAWNLYFPEEQYTVYNEAIEMVREMKLRVPRLLDMGQVERTKIFYLEYNDFKEMTESMKDKNHETVIDCVSCSVSEIMKENGFALFKVQTRLLNHTELGVEITADNCGRLTSLVGTVCRIGFKKIVLLKAFFECTKCHEILTVTIQDNVYSQPKKCNGNCKAKSFTFLFHHTSTVMRDVQEIKVQKIGKCFNLNGEEFTTEESVDCLLYDEHVGTISPGDVLRVCGIICAENESNSLYKLVLKVNNFEHLNNKNLLVVESERGDFELFKSISKTKDIISTLIHSLYPNIFGHELIKVGLLLSLFGGTRKYVGQSPIRSEIHTLIVGDPGLGKSKMLLNSCSILPKSTYVSGNLTTTAGLTVSLTHDPNTGDFMADAGALVVADNGICCMDEFDKIDDHSALFEAMEEQKVTVAKGGVVCSIPTRSTIIAASNPKYGHFNKNKSIKDNLRFDNALLSRFDLIFILVDDLNEKENYEISDQILKKRHLNSASTSRIDDLMSSIRTDPFIKPFQNKPQSLIPIENIRKYISYARNSVFPALSSSAKEEIKKFYLEIREKASITTRDLESLIRLTEARAKLELRSIATKEDATFSINLYKRLLKKEDLKKSNRRTLKGLVEELKDIATRKGHNSFSKNEIVDLIKSCELNKPTDEVIETLNYKGLLIKKGQNEYQLIN